MRMVLGMIVGVPMGMMMNVQIGWNHGEMLYYNITPVHSSTLPVRAGRRPGRNALPGDHVK